MVIFTIIAIVIAALAALSLHGTYDTRRDLKSGRPSYESLMDFTGIYDFAQLAELCDTMSEDERYDISYERALNLPRTLYARITTSYSYDLACISACITAVVMKYHDSPHAWTVLAIVGIIECCAWAYAGVAIFRLLDGD